MTAVRQPLPRTYPPEPWHLRARASVGLLPVRRDRLPAVHAPGDRPLLLGPWGLVAVAFLRYVEPSPLVYDEVLVAVLARSGWRPSVSITHIWVDSPASRDGGRALWGIPKQLAGFRTSPAADGARAPGAGSIEAALTTSGVAGLVVEPSPGRARGLPLPVRFSVSQSLHGVRRRTPVTGRARVRAGRGRWSFAGDGPLGFLLGRRPLTLALDDVRLVFGRRPVAAPPLRGAR